MNYECDVISAAVRNLYARQAHLIDAGRHDEWAHTFTENGEFHSPTYGKPAIGYEQLIGISRAFTASAEKSGERHRHLFENIWVSECDETTAQARAYLSIIASQQDGGQLRILRIVTITDQLEKSEDEWRVRHRTVTY